jgi:hypothetical protein
MKTTFETCKNIRSVLLLSLSECAIYKSWEDSYTLETIRSVSTKILERYGTIDPNDLTLKEMEDLGFRRWSEETPIMLIPLWIFPFLPDELECECIDGEKGVRSKDRIDSDHRFGLLAYGVIPKEKKSTT